MGHILKNAYYTAVLISVASCSEYNPGIRDMGSPELNVNEITVVAPDLEEDGGTKTNLDRGTVFSWENDDRLGFVPASATEYPEVVQPMMFYVADVSLDGKSAKYRGNGWGLLKGARYYSCYPYDAAGTVSSVHVNYSGQVQVSDGGSEHLGDYDYMHTWADIASDEDDITIQYRRIGCTARMVFTIPSEYRTTAFTGLTLSADKAVFMTSGIYNPLQEYPICGTAGQAETVTFSNRQMSCSFTMALGGGDGITCDTEGQLTIYAMMSPTAWAGQNIEVCLDGSKPGSKETVHLSGRITPSKNQSAGVCYKYSAALSGDEYVNLSEQESANCYIVTSSGKYRFRADVKGNGHPVGSESSALATPACAYLVWETANTAVAPARNSIVTNVEYKNGYVYFEVPDNNVAGNAMIALLNTPVNDSFTANGGKTIWVWHIWRCSSVPSDNNYGDNIIFMDRNLGALNNTPGSGLAIGLLYQWGRPVPYLGAAGYSSNAEAKARIANISNPSAGSSVSIPFWTVNGTYSLNDIFGSPMQFIVGSNGNRHWSSEYKLALWGTTKTQYDPCPPGYKVPSTFTGFSLDGSFNNIGGNLKYGNGSSFWWPVTGIRGLNFDKELTNAGHDCFYWSCETGYYSAVSDNVAYGLNFNLNANSQVFTRQPSYIISGNSVRCQKIK